MAKVGEMEGGEGVPWAGGKVAGGNGAVACRGGACLGLLMSYQPPSSTSVGVTANKGNPASVDGQENNEHQANTAKAAGEGKYHDRVRTSAHRSCAPAGYLCAMRRHSSAVHTTPITSTVPKRQAHDTLASRNSHRTYQPYAGGRAPPSEVPPIPWAGMPCEAAAAAHPLVAAWRSCGCTPGDPPTPPGDCDAAAAASDTHTSPSAAHVQVQPPVRRRWRWQRRGTVKCTRRGTGGGVPTGRGAHTRGHRARPVPTARTGSEGTRRGRGQRRHPCRAVGRRVLHKGRPGVHEGGGSRRARGVSSCRAAKTRGPGG